jgi:hypothetical protein
MADETQDIFGKIDAMLGKRAGFAGKRLELEEDFPMLTEVVSEGVNIATSPAVDALSVPPPSRQPEATLDTGTETAMHLSEVDIDRLAAALEARLSELFIRQQLRIESLVRRVVREELAARKDSVPPRL